MITILKDPSPVPAMLRQGQCWKLGNKVAEITACSPDLVRVTTWKPITSLTIFQPLFQDTITQHSLHEFRDQLGASPLKVFLSTSHPNGTKQIIGMLQSASPGRHLHSDHVLQHLEAIRDLPRSPLHLIYTDGSFMPTGGPFAACCCPAQQRLDNYLHTPT